MTGFLSENSPLEDALDAPDQAILVSSDGSESSLHFRRLQADIQQNVNFSIQAEHPQNTHGTFNASTAHIADVVPPAGGVPAPAPDYSLTQDISITPRHS